MLDDGYRLLVVGGWPATPFLERLYDGLLERGVTLLVPSRRRPTASWRGRRGFSWIPMPAWGRRAWLHPWRLLRGRMSSHSKSSRAHGRHDLAAMVAMDPDVIYFPWNSAAIRSEVLFDAGVPIVLSCRGRQVNTAPWDPQRSDLREGLRRTLGRATAVHCVSNAIREQARRWGLGAGAGVVIRPAVPIPAVAPAPPEFAAGERLRLVSVGALEWTKGHTYALGAVAELYARGLPVEYHIVGGGAEEDRLRYEVLDLGIDSMVTLHGHVDSEGVVEHLVRAHVFLLPSVSEGISNAALEAMAHGRPVVSTTCGGMQEVIDDGLSGLLVPPRDSFALADAVEGLARSPSLARRLAEAGRERVSTDHRLEDQITAFHRLFEGLATGGTK